MTEQIYAAIKSGTARSKDGAEKDRGTIVHAVTNNNYPSWAKALCGAVPGRRGNGWHYNSTKQEITCAKCLSKINHTHPETKTIK
jgi:hypothetical protein